MFYSNKNVFKYNKYNIFFLSFKKVTFDAFRFKSYENKKRVCGKSFFCVSRSEAIFDSNPRPFYAKK